MKTINTFLIFLLFAGMGVQAQERQQEPDVQVSTIEPYRLDISTWKTTNIIFPFAIISVDRGSKDVLAQKASGVKNILQVKAAREGFAETNLTVVTADGKLNSFILNFAHQPTIINLTVLDGKRKTGSIFTPENFNEQEVVKCSKAALASRKKVGGLKDDNSGVSFQVNGFFVNNEVLYCRVKIHNRSNLNYGIDQLRFFIWDQKKSKRTATQEIEVTPLYIYQPIEKVEGRKEYTVVYALSKFTIPDKKYMAIQLFEKNGGRHLEVRIKNNTIIQSLVIPNQ